MTETILADGTTASGVKVHAVQIGDHFADVKITVDGQPAALTGHPMTNPRLYRDGGTRVYETDKGTLVLPRKLNSADRIPRWEGEPLGELPPEVLKEQADKRRTLIEVARRESGWR